MYMSDSKSVIFTTENLFKGTMFLMTMFLQGVIVFYNVKAEIHDNKINYEADKRVVEFRLHAIEQNMAVLPKEVKIEEGK
ncbi:hypothetical protein CCP3SC1AL1_350005 [Gammaproteobacteria bacterium]